MAMVNVVTIADYRRIYWLRLIGLVQRLAAARRSCYTHQMNLVNSHSGSAMMTAPWILSCLSVAIYNGPPSATSSVSRVHGRGSIDIYRKRSKNILKTFKTWEKT